MTIAKKKTAVKKSTITAATKNYVVVGDGCFSDLEHDIMYTKEEAIKQAQSDAEEHKETYYVVQIVGLVESERDKALNNIPKL